MRLFSNSEQEDVVEKKSFLHEVEPEVFVEATDSIDKIIEEDSLLIQIDEFRKKAEALQNLINDKQNKVLNLEEIVKQKESMNYQLQTELAKKQEALNSVFEDMKDQFDILANRVDTSVNNAVNEAKEPVIEKIHTENVRLYRNLYDFVKEDYNTEQLIEKIINKMNPTKKFIGFSIFLSLVNLAILIVLLLINYGIL